MKLLPEENKIHFYWTDPDLRFFWSFYNHQRNSNKIHRSPNLVLSMDHGNKLLVSTSKKIRKTGKFSSPIIWKLHLIAKQKWNFLFFQMYPCVTKRTVSRTWVLVRFRSAKEVDGQFSLKCPNISSIYYDNMTFYRTKPPLLNPVSWIHLKSYSWISNFPLLFSKWIFSRT